MPKTIIKFDTGASQTEFSDKFLKTFNFLKTTKGNIEIKKGLQTQKYKKINVPIIEICTHRLKI